MPISIAMAGKGGTGKTTISGLLIKYLIDKNQTPILAVDADCNANLNEVLGVAVKDTLGGARDQMKEGAVPSGMTKDIFMSMKLETAIVETPCFDLIAMGHPEGSGCYCAANNLLSSLLEQLVNNYRYIVMDNEAGMEHISRLTTNDVDVLLLVSDASHRGLQAAIRIHQLADRLKIGAKETYLLFNRCRDSISSASMNLIEKENIKLAGMIPMDDQIYQYDYRGLPSVNIPVENPAIQVTYKIFEDIIPVDYDDYGSFNNI